jgi:hypothetical protein
MRSTALFGLSYFSLRFEADAKGHMVHLSFPHIKTASKGVAPKQKSPAGFYPNGAFSNN